MQWAIYIKIKIGYRQILFINVLIELKKKSVASIQESKIFCIQYSNITIKQF